jgi:hypothetical protein
MTAQLRFFEVNLNQNYMSSAYTLQAETPEKALQLAIDEAKLNKNSSVDLFEVDENGNLLDYSSGLILV